MTELDRLRELLDEAGVSYLNRSSDITIGYYTVDPQSVTEAMDGSLQMTGLTAEQVMRALGRGECRRTKHEGDGFEYCSECGGMLARWIDYSGKEPCFCPSCGREVVDDG